MQNYAPWLNCISHNPQKQHKPSILRYFDNIMEVPLFMHNNVPICIQQPADSQENPQAYAVEELSILTNTTQLPEVCKQTHQHPGNHPPVDLAELTYYRAARCIYEANRNALEHIWEDGHNPEANLYRMIRDLELPTLKRTQLIGHQPTCGQRGMFLGLSLSHDHRPFAMPLRDKHRRVISTINNLLQAQNINFAYTSICLSLNVRCKIHIDNSNEGPSYTITLDPFTGGQLWQQTDQGTKVVPPSQLTLTNGNHAHATLPFFGQRVSIVLYSHTSFSKPSATSIHETLQRDGFLIPTIADRTYPTKAREEIASIIEHTWRAYAHECDEAAFLTASHTVQQISELKRHHIISPLARFIISAVLLAAQLGHASTTRPNQPSSQSTPNSFATPTFKQIWSATTPTPLTNPHALNSGQPSVMYIQGQRCSDPTPTTPRVPISRPAKAVSVPELAPPPQHNQRSMLSQVATFISQGAARIRSVIGGFGVNKMSNDSNRARWAVALPPANITLKPNSPCGSEALDGQWQEYADGATFTSVSKKNLASASASRSAVDTRDDCMLREFPEKLSGMPFEDTQSTSGTIGKWCRKLSASTSGDFGTDGKKYIDSTPNSCVFRDRSDPCFRNCTIKPSTLERSTTTASESGKLETSPRAGKYKEASKCGKNSGLSGVLQSVAYVYGYYDLCVRKPPTYIKQATPQTFPSDGACHGTRYTDPNQKPMHHIGSNACRTQTKACGLYGPNSTPKSDPQDMPKAGSGPSGPAMSPNIQHTNPHAAGVQELPSGESCRAVSEVNSIGTGTVSNRLHHYWRTWRSTFTRITLKPTPSSHATQVPSLSGQLELTSGENCKTVSEVNSSLDWDEPSGTVPLHKNHPPTRQHLQRTTDEPSTTFSRSNKINFNGTITRSKESDSKLWVPKLCKFVCL